MSLETVQAVARQLPVGLEPFVELDQGLWVQLIPATLPVSSDLHETGLAQQAQVLRDTRLAEAEKLDQLSHRSGAPS